MRYLKHNSKNNAKNNFYISFIKFIGILLAFLLVFSNKIYAELPNNSEINIIIPFGPGGSADLLAKQIAPSLEKKLNAKIKVSNIRGITGSVGLMQVKDAKADGLWLGIATSSALIGNAVVSGNRNYHPLDDFTHIAVIATVPHILMAKKSLNITTFNQFTDLAKNSTNEYRFISSGYGSSGHLLFEKLHNLIGGNLEHKAASGGSATLKALSDEGRAHFLIDQLPAAVSFINSNHVDPLAIAITATKRLDTLPNVPTFNELGLNDVNRMSMYTLVAPKGVAQDIVDQIQDALAETLQEQDTKNFFKQYGMQVGTVDDEQVIAQIKEEFDFYLAIAKENNLIKITTK